MLSSQQHSSSGDPPPSFGNAPGGGSGGDPSTKPLEAKIKVKKRTCSVSGCKNGVVQGGVCVAHGAKRRKCQFSGCDKNSKCAGLCSKHGPPRKKCSAEGCNNVAVQGGKCKSHGAVSKKCDVPGCVKFAVLAGYCKRHRNYKKVDVKIPTEDKPTAVESNTAVLGGSDNNIMLAQDCNPASTLNNFAINQVMTMAAAANGSMGNFNPMLLAAALGMNPVGMNFAPCNSTSLSMPTAYYGVGGHGVARQGGTDHVYNHPTEAGLQENVTFFNGNNGGVANQGGTDHVYNHDTENCDGDSKPAALPVAFVESQTEGLSPISNE